MGFLFVVSVVGYSVVVGLGFGDCWFWELVVGGCWMIWLGAFMLIFVVVFFIFWVW